jgi:hypothetical protein
MLVVALSLQAAAAVPASASASASAAAIGGGGDGGRCCIMHVRRGTCAMPTLAQCVGLRSVPSVHKPKAKLDLRTSALEHNVLCEVILVGFVEPLELLPLNIQESVPIQTPS